MRDEARAWGQRYLNQKRDMAASFSGMPPLLDALFFNTDGDPDFSKFMAAEQQWRKLRKAP